MSRANKVPEAVRRRIEALYDCPDLLAGQGCIQSDHACRTVHLQLDQLVLLQPKRSEDDEDPYPAPAEYYFSIADRLRCYIRSSEELNSRPCPFKPAGEQLKGLSPFLAAPELDRERIVWEQNEREARLIRTIDGDVDDGLGSPLNWGLGESFRILARKRTAVETQLSSLPSSQTALLKLLIGSVPCPGIDERLSDDLRWALAQSDWPSTFHKAVLDPRFPANLLRLALANARALVRTPKRRSTDLLDALVDGLGMIYRHITDRPPTAGSPGNRDGMSRFEAFALPIVKLVSPSTEIDSLRHAIRSTAKTKVSTNKGR